MTIVVGACYRRVFTPWLLEGARCGLTMLVACVVGNFEGFRWCRLCTVKVMFLSAILVRSRRTFFVVHDLTQRNLKRECATRTSGTHSESL